MFIDTLQEQLKTAFVELKVPQQEKATILAFLAPLRIKDPITYVHYEHSVRVGLLCKQIARFVHLDEKVLFYAGLMHDIGKCQVCLDTLGKTDVWTATDIVAIKEHVMDSYRFLRGRFDFSAEVVVLHHRFQEDAYPAELPAPLHPYSGKTKVLILMYGRMLALADVYDALHRSNSKFGAHRVLNGEEIKTKMMELNTDQRQLILDLYSAGVFTI